MTKMARYSQHPAELQAPCGQIARHISVLHPCSAYSRRTARVFHDASTTRLSSPRTELFPPPANEKKLFFVNQEVIGRGRIQYCTPISINRFYHTFNRLALDLYKERLNLGSGIAAGLPVIFEPQGTLVPDQKLKQLLKVRVTEPNMPSSCKDIREALAQCLQESDCVMVYRNKPGDCLREPLIDTMPTKCQQLKKGLGECKRGMVDMRKRFRGNQPIAVSKELEGGAQEPSNQLYAGKPAFSGTVKTTSGDEPEERDWRELENEKFRKA